MDDVEYAMVSLWMEDIVEFLKENPEANPLKPVRISRFRFWHFIESGGS